MVVTDISIPLQYILSGTLSNRPTTGQFEGQIFYATDTKDAYRWNGSSWDETTVNLDAVNRAIGLNGLNILDLTAQASLTAGINANFERDIYSQPSGYLETVSSSTLTFEQDGKYTNNYYVAQDLTASGSYTTPYGVKITIGDEDIVFTGVKLMTGCTATRLLVQSISGTILATGTITDLVGSFVSNPTLSAHTSYYIMVDNNGANQTRAYESTSITGENVVYGNVTLNTGATGTTPSVSSNYYNIRYLYFENNYNGTITTNKINLNSTPTKFMIVAHETTTGTGTINYDISFDNGANYLTNLNSFTEYDIVDTGSELILKQNFNVGETIGYCEATDYGVLIW